MAKASSLLYVRGNYPPGIAGFGPFALLGVRKENKELEAVALSAEQARYRYSRHIQRFWVFLKEFAGHSIEAPSSGAGGNLNNWKASASLRGAGSIKASLGRSASLDARPLAPFQNV